MRITAIVLSISLMACSAFAGDWPQFQGPNRNGISDEKGLADSWPAQGPKELWAVPVGVGFGGAAIVGGNVYILDRVGEAKDAIRSFDLSTGKELWSYEYDAPGKVDYPGSRCTPAIDGKNLYVVGPFGDFTCLSLETHKPVWSHHLIKDFGGKLPHWGVAQSAVVHGELVIVAPQSTKAGVVAYNKADGKLVWSSAPIGEMAYQSPYVTTLHGVEQVVMSSGKATVGIDVASGKVLWSFEGWVCKIPIPCATNLGDGRFFLTGDYNAGSAMFKVAHEGGQWTTAKLFATPAIESKMHDALYYGGHLYANGSCSRKGLLCADTDGKVLWQTQVKGKKDGVDFDQGGAVMIADGKLFAMMGKGGTLYMVKAGPEKFDVLGKAKLLSGDMVWAPMAISEGKLVCRDQKQIKCFDLK